MGYHIDFNIWKNINCFEETHQVLYELFFGNSFDSPTIDAVTGEVSRNAGCEVTDFDVLRVQEVSAEQLKHKQILRFLNKGTNSINKAGLKWGITLRDGMYKLDPVEPMIRQTFVQVSLKKVIQVIKQS